MPPLKWCSILAMNLGFVQTSPIFGEKERNFEEVRSLVASRTDRSSVDLLVLPELFATGYTFASREEAASLAEPADGPTAAFLRTIAATTGGTVVAGFAESDNGKVYNSSLIVRSDAILGTYRKMHLFNREKLWFDPGDRAPRAYDAGGVAFGVMICFDWLFPEVMRMLMLLGARVVAHPSNLVLPYCQEAMKTRCLENRMFAVTANRIGREKHGDDEFYFTGASQITAPDGSVLSSAPGKERYLDVVTVDADAAASKKINPYNDLVEDRRVDLFDVLVARGKPERRER